MDGYTARRDRRLSREEWIRASSQKTLRPNAAITVNESEVVRMPGTILFVASNPTATKFDFKGELTAIRAAASRRRHSKLNLVARWSVDAVSLREAIVNLRPAIVHLVSPG